jgi:hypothetical protein
VRTLLFGLVLAAGAGCTSVQPVGPLAKYLGGKKPETKAAVPGMETPPAASTAARPTPPAVLITPGEVSADNPAAAAQQLTRELEYDQKTMQKGPIISAYKNGEKVR